MEMLNCSDGAISTAGALTAYTSSL